MAFLAGAVAMLVLALIWVAWDASRDASRAAQSAAGAVDVLPDLERPRLPAAPPIPDAPVPTPR